VHVSRFLVLAFLVLAFFLSLGGAGLSGQVAPPTKTLDRADSVSAQPSTSTQPVLPPENPTPHREIDKKFIVVMATLGATESMRFTTRELVLDDELSEGAPWVTAVPSHTHLILKYAPIYATELLVVYEIKKPHAWLPGDRVLRKLWWLYPATMGTIHVHNAIGNIETPSQPTCPVGRCQ